eukprot:12423655-Karenia_brevis.AAC.1
MQLRNFLPLVSNNSSNFAGLKSRLARVSVLICFGDLSGPAYNVSLQPSGVETKRFVHVEGPVRRVPSALRALRPPRLVPPSK